MYLGLGELPVSGNSPQALDNDFASLWLRHSTGLPRYRRDWFCDPVLFLHEKKKHILR